MDYGFSEKRKSKNDKRAKARFNRYKKGGQFRSNNISVNSNQNSDKKVNK